MSTCRGFASANWTLQLTSTERAKPGGSSDSTAFGKSVAGVSASEVIAMWVEMRQRPKDRTTRGHKKGPRRNRGPSNAKLLPLHATTNDVLLAYLPAATVGRDLEPARTEHEPTPPPSPPPPPPRRPRDQRRRPNAGEHPSEARADPTPETDHQRQPRTPQARHASPTTARAAVAQPAPNPSAPPAPATAPDRRQTAAPPDDPPEAHRTAQRTRSPRRCRRHDPSPPTYQRPPH